MQRSIKRAVFRLRNRHLYDEQQHRGQLQALAPLFLNKRVALVGNAQSIFGRRHGRTIDEHDVVVRLNKGRVLDTESQGRRTDVLCLACSLADVEVLEMFGSPTIIWVTPKRELLAPSLRRMVTCYPVSEWEPVYQALSKRRPSAGLISLNMLRQSFAPSRISVFGFDWKATRTFYHDRHTSSHHDWEAERRLVASWSARDPRVLIN